MNICTLLLAAGGSSRLGRAKQLVREKGKTLVEKAIDSAHKAGLESVYVVLGARYKEIQTTIEHLPVHLIRNENWQEGIGSSISTGMQTITTSGAYEAVLIMLCDQLHINSSHLSALLESYQNNRKGIIASAYANQIGVPALFDQQYFSALQQLSGDTGAKKIISRHSGNLHTIAFEQAIIDIDTPEDLREVGLE